MSEEKMINLRLFSKKINLDDRTKDYIVKRISKMEKILKKTLEYEVEVSMDKKGHFRVEVMVQTPYKLYRTEETTESVEGSLDLAVDQMQRQITQDIEKNRDLKKRGARSIKKKMVIDEAARF